MFPGGAGLPLPRIPHDARAAQGLRRRAAAQGDVRRDGGRRRHQSRERAVRPLALRSRKRGPRGGCPGACLPTDVDPGIR